MGLQQLVKSVEKAIAPKKSAPSKKAKAAKFQRSQHGSKKKKSRGGLKKKDKHVVKAFGGLAITNGPTDKGAIKMLYNAGEVDVEEKYRNFISTKVNTLVEAGGEGVEDVSVQINPFYLFQYILGIVRSTLVYSDRVADSNFCDRVALYYFNNMDNTDFIGVSTWPHAILKLAYSLRNRRVGNYNYSACWDYRNATIAAIKNKNVGTLPFIGYTALSFATTVPVGGFLPVTLGMGDIPSDTEVINWQNSHATLLRLVPIIGSEGLDCGDASAFCYDVGGMSIINDIQGSGTQVVCIGNYDLPTTTFYYGLQNTTVASETKFRDKKLASLRLGTSNNRYSVSDTNVTTQVSPVRVPNFTQAVRGTPGMFGYNEGVRYCPDSRFPKITKPVLGNRCQLKPVPGVFSCQGIVDRLEAMGTLTGSNFFTTYNPDDVKAMAYILHKRMLRKYSGAEVGSVNISAGVPNYPDNYGLHCDDILIDTCRFPEPISNYIGSQTAYRDEEGGLAPWVSCYDWWTTSVSGTYTGAPTATYTNPADANRLWTMRTPTLNGNLFGGIWRSNDFMYAKVANMLPGSIYGKTLLDATIIRDTANTSVVGICARRRVTDLLISRVLACAQGVSFTGSNFNASSGSSANVLTTIYASQYDHQYGQRSRVDLSGFLSVTNANKSGKYDGYVPAGIATYNESGNTRPDGEPGSSTGAASLNPLQAPRSAVGSVLKDQLLAAASPRWGKYCGAGWTAGERGGSPIMEGGRYVIPPESLEDAACKLHDEAYYHAAGDPVKKARADQEFVENLRNLEAAGELSWKGKAAKVYFSDHSNREL